VFSFIPPIETDGYFYPPYETNRRDKSGSSSSEQHKAFTSHTEPRYTDLFFSSRGDLVMPVSNVSLLSSATAGHELRCVIAGAQTFHLDRYGKAAVI
jgi:hypothetical protein